MHSTTTKLLPLQRPYLAIINIITVTMGKDLCLLLILVEDVLLVLHNTAEVCALLLSTYSSLLVYL